MTGLNVTCDLWTIYILYYTAVAWSYRYYTNAMVNVLTLAIIVEPINILVFNLFEIGVYIGAVPVFD